MATFVDDTSIMATRDTVMEPREKLQNSFDKVGTRKRNWRIFIDSEWVKTNSRSFYKKKKKSDNMLWILIHNKKRSGVTKNDTER